MLDDIYLIETIEQLTARIQEEPSPDALRQALFAECDSYADYANIREWNKLVRVCEATALSLTMAATRRTMGFQAWLPSATPCRKTLFV